MKKCVHCGHPVAKGDRHAMGACPPKAGTRPGTARHQKRVRRIKAKSRANRPAGIQRGMVIAGAGRPKGRTGKQAALSLYPQLQKVGGFYLLKKFFYDKM